MGRADVSVCRVAAHGHCRSRWSSGHWGQFLGIRSHGLLGHQHLAWPCPAFRWHLPLGGVPVNRCLCVSSTPQQVSWTPETYARRLVLGRAVAAEWQSSFKPCASFRDLHGPSKQLWRKPAQLRCPELLWMSRQQDSDNS